MSRLVREALRVAVQAGEPVLVWGGPGEGKTRVIEQIAAELGRPCEVVLGSVREAVDFSGLPIRVGDSVEFVPPSWARRCVDNPNTVLFLDELTCCPPAVQAAALRVVLERVVGDLRLPKSVSIVAAANPPEIAAAGEELAGALANRFCHLTWEASVADWTAGMVTGFASGARAPSEPRPDPIAGDRWPARVAAFIRARPGVLRRLPPSFTDQGRAWPSPRSWDMAQRLARAAEVAGADRAVRDVLIAGAVGQAAAMEFIHFVDALDLPDPEEVLADPTGAVLPLGSEAVMACLAAVTSVVAADLTRDRWEAAWMVLAAVCERGQSDVAALSATALIGLRHDDWPPPAGVRAFLPLLREAALL